jgi:hypothetical protein
MPSATSSAGGRWTAEHELPHVGSVDEWLFAAWSPDAELGVLSGHRLAGARAWYWSALVRLGAPLLHLAEWDVKVRPDPFVVKAPEMWAEHHCDAPFEQWSIGNEAYFTALDDPDEALARGYGVPTPTAMDLEWYATGAADDARTETPTDDAYGYAQEGVVHGVVEIGGLGRVDLAEVPARRWRRWCRLGTALPPVTLPSVVAHTGLRAPFAFPDGSASDWVLTPSGWASRHAPPRRP